MDQVSILRTFNVIAGIVGLAIAIGLLLVPAAVAKLERTLDKEFQTQSLEKLLNQRRNLTEILLRHPRIFGIILLVVSFLLVASIFGL